MGNLLSKKKTAACVSGNPTRARTRMQRRCVNTIKSTAGGTGNFWQPLETVGGEATSWKKLGRYAGGL